MSEIHCTAPYIKLTADSDVINDLLIFESIGGSKDLVVYFGGDVQDCEEDMINNGAREFVNWSFECIGSMLRTKFNDSNVVVVRPDSYTFKTFAKFEKFVHSDDYGTPHKVPDSPKAVDYLKQILCKVEARRNLNHDKVVLIGFSKGCTVMNQIAYELLTENLQSLAEMYWLDGGHNGTKRFWITDETVVITLLNKRIGIHFYATAYQLKGGLKRQEFFELRSILRRNNCEQYMKVYFPDNGSLLAHFRVLEVFDL